MAFATTADVAARLGRALTTAEDDQAESLILAAQATIEVVIGRAEADLTTVPAACEHVCVSMVLRGMANPYGFASDTESLGAYTKSQTYGRDGGTDLTPTQSETLILRRAVYGTTTGSSKAEATLLKEALDEIWGS